MYPERIVCLAAEIPEILAELGVLQRVVGISAYTTRPREALSLPKVSGFQHGSTKRILQTTPDIAILTSGVQKELASLLAQEGVTMLHFNPHRLDDMFNTILLIGNLVGEPDKANQLCERLKAEVERVRLQSLKLPWRPRVYFEEWMDPIIVGTAWVSDLIEIAGGQDVFRDLSVSARKAAQRVVQEDQIIAAAPDLVLASWCGKPFEREAFVSREGFSEIPAVQAGAVFEVNSEILQCGPMLVDSLRALHEILAEFVRNHQPRQQQP